MKNLIFFSLFVFIFCNSKENSQNYLNTITNNNSQINTQDTIGIDSVWVKYKDILPDDDEYTTIYDNTIDSISQLYGHWKLGEVGYGAVEGIDTTKRARVSKNYLDVIIEKDSFYFSVNGRKIKNPQYQLDSYDLTDTQKGSTLFYGYLKNRTKYYFLRIGNGRCFEVIDSNEIAHYSGGRIYIYHKK